MNIKANYIIHLWKSKHSDIYITSVFLLLLLLLSWFSHVQLCVTPIDGSPPCSSVHRILQARILEWVTISFSNACLHAKSLQQCPTLCDPIDGSPPCSSVHRILQARILEWVAIFFSHFSSTSVSLIYKHSILWVLLYYHFMSTITWWQTDGETVETVADFYFGGLKNQCRWWLQPWN